MRLPARCPPATFQSSTDHKRPRPSGQAGPSKEPDLRPRSNPRHPPRLGHATRASSVAGRRRGRVGGGIGVRRLFLPRVIAVFADGVLRSPNVACTEGSCATEVTWDPSYALDHCAGLVCSYQERKWLAHLSPIVEGSRRGRIRPILAVRRPTMSCYNGKGYWSIRWTVQTAYTSKERFKFWSTRTGCAGALVFCQEARQQQLFRCLHRTSRPRLPCG